MTITTKFSPGDTVFYLEHNTVQSRRIKTVRTNVFSNLDFEIANTEVICVLENEKKYVETYLHPTKEALLASL